MSDVRYPDITVKLVGEDGNIFNLMGIVKRELPPPVRGEFQDEVFSAGSYDDALQVIMRWVNIS